LSFLSDVTESRDNDKRVTGNMKNENVVDDGYEEFGDLLTYYVEREQKRHRDHSLGEITVTAGVDVGHLSTLMRGVRITATTRALVRLALVLRLEPEELDRLILAAGYSSLAKTEKPRLTKTKLNRTKTATPKP